MSNVVTHAFNFRDSGVGQAMAMPWPRHGGPGVVQSANRHKTTFALWPEAGVSRASRGEMGRRCQ